MKKFIYDEAKASPGVYRFLGKSSHTGDILITSHTGVIYINSFGTPPYSILIEGNGAEQRPDMNHYRNEVQYARLEDDVSAD